MPGEEPHRRPLAWLWLRLALRQPHALGRYVEACGDLLLAHARASATALAWQFRCEVIATAAATAGVLLGGGALLLWAAVPAGSMPHGWLLWAVPAIPLAAALVAVSAARRFAAASRLSPLLAQLQADAGRLQAALACAEAASGAARAQEARAGGAAKGLAAVLELLPLLLPVLLPLLSQWQHAFKASRQSRSSPDERR
jgi:hypothetical protein